MTDIAAGVYGSDELEAMMSLLIKIMHEDDIDLLAHVHEAAAEAEDDLAALRCEPHDIEYAEAARKHEMLYEMQTVLERAKTKT